MKFAETVTFGGTGYDRAAHLRGNTDDQRPDAQAIVLWRGKPLIHDDALVRLSLDHPVCEGAQTELFLGLPDDAPLFAVDISHWQPESVDSDAFDSFLDTTEQTHPALPDDHVFAELRGIMTRLSALDAELAATARAVLGWHKTHRFCSKCGHESEATQSGWQRTCPACGGHHFPRTDPVVIMLITSGNKVLLGRSPGWPEGMYSLLAGFIEPGETVEAAVRREVFEEAGVKVGAVSYLASQPWAFPSSLMIGCRGEALSEEITIDPQEIEDAIWISREELAIAFRGEHRMLKPARKGAIAQFLMAYWLADQLD